MKKSGAIVGGLLIGFVGAVLALGLSGGGDGWNTPLWASPVLWVTYPAVLVRSRLAPSERSMTVEFALFIAALVGDVALMLFTLNEGL